jgi:hypothetical protein
MALHVPDFYQTKLYPAQALRETLLDQGLQEGVVGDAIAGFSTPFKVSQRAASANMTVDVAGGGAYVRGDYSSRQGLYHVFNDAVANVSIGANGTGNPRIDQVILRIHDTTDGGGAQDAATIEVLAGGASAGATLDNRTGAQTLPGGAIRLADVLVGAGVGSITNSNIRDRRPWAHGVRYVDSLVAGPVNAGISAPGSLFADARVECTGNPMRVEVGGGWYQNNGAAGTWSSQINLYIDGVSAGIINFNVENFQTGRYPAAGGLVVTPAAGSRLIALYLQGNGGAIQLYNAQLLITELLRTTPDQA